ncbi:MAG: DUF4350 domain-containing protein [Wenzhouxiangella sp.]
MTIPKAGQRKERLLIGLSLMLVVGAAFWWYWSGEYEEQLIYRPDNPKLRTEPFHVAQRLLDQNGFDTTALANLQALDSLPAERSTLIISAAPGHHNDLEARQLAGWLARGGHLIASAPRGSGERRSSTELNPHGVTTSRCQVAEDISGTESDTTSICGPNLISLQTPGGQALELWAQSYLALPSEQSGLSIWRDEQGHPVVAEYHVGPGLATLLPTSRWLDNEHLVYADHVRLLLALAGNRDGPIYLQQRSTPGGLLGWLWNQAPLLWLALALLALLWVWSRMPRLGPMTDSSAASNLQMRERVLATARFDWRHNQGGRLLAAMREERDQHCARRYPDWRRLDRHQQLKRLEPLVPDSGRDALAWLLDLEAAGNPEQFIEYVRLHKQLMQALQGGRT